MACSAFRIHRPSRKCNRHRPRILPGTTSNADSTLSQPVFAVQQVLPKSTVTIGSTTIVLAQDGGGATFLATDDAVF